jgi:hypothetical protein
VTIGAGTGMKPYQFRSAAHGFVTVTADSITYGSLSATPKTWEAEAMNRVDREAVIMVAVEGADTVSAGRVAAFGVYGAIAKRHDAVAVVTLADGTMVRFTGKNLPAAEIASAFAVRGWPLTAL